MADDNLFNVDTDDAAIQTQQVLLAAAHHDLESLRTLFRTISAAVQDPETGYSPLHTAIASNVDEGSSSASNGPSNGQAATSHVHMNGNSRTERPGDSDEKPGKIIEAEKTLRLLFQNGAVWNELDANGETPGCLAWRLGFMSLYEIIVDAGVRAELLLNRMDEFELLAGGEEDGSENDDDDNYRTDERDATITPHANNQASTSTAETESGAPTPQIVIETETPASAQATAAEHNAASFLASELTFQDGRILDSARAGVMMAWETDIMRKSATLLLPSPGLRVLNIGHGMGIIDGIFQDHENRPISHHVVEAHPQVLAQMRETGWYEKDQVTVHKGRWQDVLPKLISEGEIFDAIYFDTFAEDYKAFREFFSEYVIGLLEPAGSWSFFNGLGADRRVVYDVYTKVCEMDLFEAGFDTEWENVDVPSLEQTGEWNGVQRPYWTLDVIVPSALESFKIPSKFFSNLWQSIANRLQHGPRSSLLRDFFRHMGNEESSLIDDSIQPMTLKSRDIDGLAEYLKSGKVKKVVVMTGAGISTSAGIPDFRSPETGLYANLARLDLPYAEAVFDISYFRRNPLPFYTLAHELYPGKFRPTIVHSFIRLLNDKNMLLKHFTQNIDILDRKAGVPADKIIEAHGSFARQSCIECNTKFPDAEMKKHIDKKEVPHCKSPKCDGLVKPEIVFFGEALPHEFFLGRGLPAEADLCIVLGSSLTVHPFASLPELVSEGTPRVLINLERVGSLGSRPDDVLLLGDCDEQVKKLAEKAGWLEELERLWDATALEGDKEENEKAEQPRKGEITEAQKNPGTTEEKDKALEDEVDKLTKDIDESLKVSGKHIEDNKNEPTGPPTDDGGKGQSHVEPDGKKDSSL